ncbi:MAG: DNA repair protein RecN [Ilumatobacteraceae bacterium]|nr:DNA repair protein RecN [Acidimicrobiaceae bacterium]MBP7888626.1 DNA repair protein RecN [Ilumatobacteraceae bacterium]MBK9971003.1 DNA repair protein RecN [Acidimicrobiaceae bacterium]MBP8210116.1 DNA repair protein RecN [Ilumatobacteraceae bacterium]MBP9054582.1 DNA repair protein RecN [Ilumatobacteraceae bacterium]
MLQELHIESLGVIEQLDLVLGAGLTALTGETGAGKTLLVEAISLLVGGRADATMVRPGAAEARVEGRFVVGDDEYVVARVVPADGRSRAYVNGRLATVGNLAELGARFVDLHGQHSHQSLLSAAEQRDALDRYCRTDLGPLRAARARLTELDAALAALGGDSKSRARELDLLRFQAAELRAAAIASSQEDADLDAELDELAGAVEYRELGRVAVDALSDEGGAGDSIAAAVRALAGRAPFAELESRLRGLGAEVQDVAADLRRRAEDIEEDPERLDAVRGRLQLLRDLRRKYGDSLAEVIGFHDEVEHRLAELEGYEGRVADLERERQAAAAGERTAAASVGRARRAGAGALADEVQHHLRELAMPHATVAVTVGEHDPGDEVSFLLAANPGSPLLPLARVASGGELARTMLALRLVLTEAPDTLVFDEVDAGIGGSAAVAVGRNLAALGARHQVLVVTHLAQVAALAHTHVVVSKRVLAGATLTTAARIDGQDRVDEVARMLSGDEAADSARRHAADLLGDRAKRASG